MSDVFGTVLRCQKGQGWTTRTEILCFLFGSDMVAGSWLGGCFGVGKQTEIWRGRSGGYRIEIFFELDAVISGGLSEKYLIDTY